MPVDPDYPSRGFICDDCEPEQPDAAPDEGREFAVCWPQPQDKVRMWKRFRNAGFHFVDRPLTPRERAEIIRHLARLNGKRFADYVEEGGDE